MRLKLFIEYNGTRYSGWQLQKNANTIQGILIKSIEKVFAETKGTSKFNDLQGSGRTDSGVHATEQVAHLDCETMLSPHILKMKINNELPSDINIIDIEKANKNFHARHSAISRQYVYRISKRRTAFEKKYVWWIKDRLNVEFMREASKLFLGMHDFQSFSELDEENKSTKVFVEKLEVKEEGDLILIRIRASHFLWKMVRRIAGTLVEIGRENIDQLKLKSYLENYSDEPSKFTAPPSGLFLEKIFYD